VLEMSEEEHDEGDVLEQKSDDEEVTTTGNNAPRKALGTKKQHDKNTKTDATKKRIKKEKAVKQKPMRRPYKSYDDAPRSKLFGHTCERALSNIMCHRNFVRLIGWAIAALVFAVLMNLMHQQRAWNGEEKDHRNAHRGFKDLSISGINLLASTSPQGLAYHPAARSGNQH